MTASDSLHVYYRLKGMWRATLDGFAGPEAPEEVRERFEGRAFTLLELEKRGVRMAGGLGTYSTEGETWYLTVIPEAAQGD